MKNGEAEYLFGTEAISILPMRPFEEQICHFLDALSKALRDDREAMRYPDIITFAFWIRKANLCRLKGRFCGEEMRLGKGMIFHIAPSNVPVNFAYTLVFGLLSGNSNIVRASARHFIQTDIICRVMRELTAEEPFSWVFRQNAVVCYDREAVGLTERFSDECDVRVIWGGDHTIREIRRFALQPRSTELTFADRYSFGVIRAQAVLDASDTELTDLAGKFYNDTYLMDQNACSTPHLICWLGEKETAENAAALFWRYVYQRARQYQMEEIKASEKYTILCEMGAAGHIADVKRYENYLYVARVTSLPDDICILRGKFGLFYEYCCAGMDELTGRVGKRVQTCAVYGVDRRDIADWVVKNHMAGVDRIVSFGETLDIDMIWDGYDVVRELSRCVAV